jgi:hypothetical protein
LKQGDQGFKTPEFMKAWAMIKSGGEGSKNAFLSDPFQVNNPGDWVPEKLQRFGLRKHQTMAPAASAFAALEWLRIKSRVHDGRGGVRILGDEGALERYNGNRVKTRQSGELLHSQWYAATILQMAQQAGRARK